MFILTKIASLFFLFMTLSACSPGLAPALRLDGFSKLEESNSSDKIFLGKSIQFGKVFDGRKDDAIGRISNEKLPPATEVTEAATGRLRERLEHLGFTFSATASQELRVELLEWTVTVTKGFPAAEAHSKAVLSISVLTKGKLRYEGKYQGEMFEQTPLLSQPKIEAALASSLDYAIDEFFRDKRFETVLRQLP